MRGSGLRWTGRHPRVAIVCDHFVLIIATILTGFYEQHLAALDLCTEVVSHQRALVRWKHPDLHVLQTRGVFVATMQSAHLSLVHTSEQLSGLAGKHRPATHIAQV